MTVVPPADTSQPAAPGAVRDGAVATGPPGGDSFAQVLATHVGRPGQAARPASLTLSQMIHSVAAAATVTPPAAWPAAPMPGFAGAWSPATVAVAPLGAGAAADAGALLEAAPASGGPAGDAVVAAAHSYLGVPYRWGGTDPATGLDCSGFVQRVFADLGISVPRVSADQARAGGEVASLADARPGDLVYWRGRGGRPNHIGIYLGGGRMLHAPRTGDVVREAPVRQQPPDAIRRIA